MTDRSPIGLRQTVDLEVACADDDEANFSGVVEAFDATTVTVAINQHSRVKELPSGAPVKVTYANESGLYLFETVVVDLRRGQPDVVTIEIPEHIDRQQRRRHIRVDARLTVAGAVLDGDTLEFTAFAGRVVNVSGGGLRMAVGMAPPYTEGSPVAVAVALPDQLELLAMATLIGAHEEDGETVIRLAFTLVDPGDQDRVVRWVFRQMREERHRRLTDADHAG